MTKYVEVIGEITTNITLLPHPVFVK